eukprot:CAMPEP_0113594258 /NCGR_PEP_ID=MMETSP0015_2-20120614/38956_1 /TAXON_ID=2838 /ORGANISM="Odontella" /LENGTH=388 /DNA_ID=CAMNT_0000501193 /DNA_START=448 /DNA_END=1614 /DNA_ORIENTATION=- /assembly_acc=CAM_ASM_000160
MESSIRHSSRVLVTERGHSGGGQKGSDYSEFTVFIGIKIGAGPCGTRFREIQRTWLEDVLAEDGQVLIKFFSRASQEEGGISNVPKIEPALMQAGDDIRGTRFREIQRTWLEDVLAEDGQVLIKFFSRASQEEGGISNVPESEPALMQAGDDRAKSNITLQSLFVPTLCEQHQLTCMTSSMFAYYLQHHANDTTPMASYFCNFDDDQYVNVPNLIKVLDSYSNDQRWYGKNLYIGNPPAQNKVKWKGLYSGGVRIKFHTGGAGYCLSRDLVEQGAQYFLSLSNFPDDVAVGYVVQHKLGIEYPIVDIRFHSHLSAKYDPVKELPLEELSKQVSFGYNTKLPDERALETFPNIPLLFPYEEDPLHFRSLRCFLQNYSSKLDPPGCAPGS